jgi:hypothetical protein
MGPGWNSNSLRPASVSRHEVRSELDARKLQVQDICQRLHQLGLADSRDAFEQHVAARQQAGHDADDVVLIAYDDARNLVAYQAEVVAEKLYLTVDCNGHGRAP